VKENSRLKMLFTSSEVKVVPCSVAADAMRHVIEFGANDELVRELQQQEVWQKVQVEEDYWHGYIVLARLIDMCCFLYLADCVYVKSL